MTHANIKQATFDDQKCHVTERTLKIGRQYTVGLLLVKSRNTLIQNSVQIITNTSNRNVISDKKAGLFVHEMQ